MRARLGRYAAVGLCLFAVGCAEEEPWVYTDEVRPSQEFTENVYPVLIRDCAFHACHGSEDRLFRIWGPKRRRLYDEGISYEADAEAMRIAAEQVRTYQSAISFVDVGDPKRSLLLRKGLDPQAGGTGHSGLDKFGRNVYSSADSQGYLALSMWAFGLRAQQTE